MQTLLRWIEAATMALALALTLVLASGLPGAAARAADAQSAFVVIASAGVEKVDAATLRRLYSGRAIEIAGTPVTVANLAPDQPLRDTFLLQVAGQDNASYVAYWTVRRHVGKGVPPREFKTAALVAEWVQSTAGAVGYIPVTELRPGMNVVFRP